MPKFIVHDVGSIQHVTAALQLFHVLNLHQSHYLIKHSLQPGSFTTLSLTYSSQITGLAMIAVVLTYH